jgi:hypothetical protein
MLSTFMLLFLTYDAGFQNGRGREREAVFTCAADTGIWFDEKDCAHLVVNGKEVTNFMFEADSCTGFWKEENEMRLQWLNGEWVELDCSKGGEEVPCKQLLDSMLKVGIEDMSLEVEEAVPEGPPLMSKVVIQLTDGQTVRILENGAVSVEGGKE